MVDLGARLLGFAHDNSDSAQVADVSFTVRAGRTLGILGGNESGKTTLAQLLLGQLRANRGGSVLVDGVPLEPTTARAWWVGHVRVLLVLSAAAAALLAALQPPLLASCLQQGAWSPPLLLLVLELSHWASRFLTGGAQGDARAGWAPAAMRRRGVAYVSSEHDAGQKLPPKELVETVIGQHMPLPPKAHAARRREVLAALEAAGFQMFADTGTPIGNPRKYLVCHRPMCPPFWHAVCAPQDDGLRCEGLSGGQKHLVYVLSVLASRPRLLICDEMLCGLDIDRQSSMLSLLQTMQIEFGTTILFLSVDATSVQLMSHDAAFMHRGRLIETRAAHELFEEPKERETRSYLKLSRGNEDRSRGKNLRNAFQTGESVFDLR